jgi:hypothetical protein
MRYNNPEYSRNKIKYSPNIMNNGISFPLGLSPSMYPMNTVSVDIIEPLTVEKKAV